MRDRIDEVLEVCHRRRRSCHRYISRPLVSRVRRKHNGCWSDRRIYANIYVFIVIHDHSVMFHVAVLRVIQGRSTLASINQSNIKK